METMVSVPHSTLESPEQLTKQQQGVKANDRGRGRYMRYMHARAGGERTPRTGHVLRAKHTAAMAGEKQHRLWWGLDF